MELEVARYLSRTTTADETEHELEAIKSFERKIGYTRVQLFHSSLGGAINIICTAPVNERKALVLYLHNAQHPFSKSFSRIFRQSQIAQILNKTFLVLGWDIEEDEYRNALVDALNLHVSLSYIADYVKKKQPVCVCVIPVGGTICVFFSYLKTISLKELNESLKRVETAFEEEIMQEKELNKLKAEKSSQNDLGSEELHCMWADMLGDRDYDRFEADQHDYLKKKIGFALYGAPQKESGYDKKAKAKVDQLYQVIMKRSNEVAEFKDVIEMSFVYTCLEPLPKEKVKLGAKFADYNPRTDVTPVPFFVLRRCRESRDPCRIFIDDRGRVYSRWNDYLTKNKYPKCEMIVPLNGRYQIKDGKVLLEKHLSPACHLGRAFLLAGDITSSVVATGTVITLGVGAIPAVTIAAPVLAVAAIGGIGAGIWAIGRSAHSAYDRTKHKESMSFANSEARAIYLNIVAGTVGFAGAGANMALSLMALRGLRVGLTATRVVNTVVGVLNIGAGSASLVNSGYDVFDQWYNEHNTPSALMLLQLTTSGLFFGHAVYNFANTQMIIDESQARVVQDSLLNRHRKSLSSVMDALKFYNKGRTDVISSIRKFLNEDEVFEIFARAAKTFCRTGVNLTAEHGQIKLNGMDIDVKDFIGLNKRQTEICLSNLPQQVSGQPTSSFETSISNLLSDLGLGTTDANKIIMTGARLLLSFCSEETKTNLLNILNRAIEYILNTLAEKYAKPFYEAIDKILPAYTRVFELLQLVISFFSRKVDELEWKYQQYQKTKDLRYYDQLFDQINPVYAKRTVFFFEFIVKNGCSAGALIRASISEISNYIMAWVARILFDHGEKENGVKQREGQKTSCSVCKGHYYKQAS